MSPSFSTLCRQLPTGFSAAWPLQYGAFPPKTARERVELLLRPLRILTKTGGANRMASEMNIKDPTTCL